MRLTATILILFVFKIGFSQKIKTIFEGSGGKESSTYFQTIDAYKKFSDASKNTKLFTFDTTDSGYPLHLFLYSNTQNFNPATYKSQNKVVVLINNAIHPGEPDGIDASLMLARDLIEKRITISDNVVVAIIPVYNIGGCLNRGSNSRVNQNGPLEYGFRGNSQNLDLNRDFTKCDSKDAKAFVKIFQWLQPTVLIDNHVSDGADYQHTMTLLTTQHNKLNYNMGNFLHQTFEPALFNDMKQEGWPMCPYVNFDDANPSKGWNAFYDAPRYSSGYAALFNCIGLVPETHMLKPYKDRVMSTFSLLKVVLKHVGIHAKTLYDIKQQDALTISTQNSFPLAWKIDNAKHQEISFMGFDTAYKISSVTNLPQLYYNRNKPYTKPIKFNNYFTPTNLVTKPKAYIIPQGWHSIIELLKLNGVAVSTLKKDTLLEVKAYKIDDYQTFTKPFEKHYKHFNTKTKTITKTMQFLKGDKIVFLNTAKDRFIVEMLEPTGDDSYFNWNFFDAVLQQKEGYSNYRWNEVAEDWIEKNPTIKEQLQQKRNSDSSFAKSADKQLDFVYKLSPWYEPIHLTYPIYRLTK